MDILIKGGLIVDGTGEKPFYGDIAIDRDMITEIGENLDASKARKVVDAKGLTVTPTNRPYTTDTAAASVGG